MDKKFSDPVIQEIEGSAKNPKVVELTPEEQLLKCRVTPKTELPPMENLFQLFGKACFFRGELAAVCGKAKSGKTLWLSILMACALRGECLSLKREQRPESQPLRILWIDTEQSQQSTQDIQINRLMPLAGMSDLDDSLFFAYNLRGLGFERRRKLVEVAIQTVEPDLVIIDGIKDLMPDINDAVQATLLMEQLMLLAQNHNCCIVNVLHQNKNEADHNMRGSIGTELTNKAFEVFQCEYIEDGDLFKVKHALGRKHRIRKKFYYKLNEDGMPVNCEPDEPQPRDDQGRFKSKPKQVVTPEVKWDKLNPRYIVNKGDGTYEWNLSTLFEDAFEGRPSRPFGHVMAAALRLSHIEDPKLYYKLVEMAEQQKVVRSVKQPETGDAYLEFTVNELPF